MFGELKSKIETYLTESYKSNKLKDSLFVFEHGNVLLSFVRVTVVVA